MGSVLFATLFVALQFATGLANPDSKRLYDDLLSNYNRLIRPVGNNSDRLTVKMGLRLSQLIDVVSTDDELLHPTMMYLHTITLPQLPPACVSCIVPCAINLQFHYFLLQLLVV